MTHKERIDVWRYNGILLGYPKCCIDSFCNDPVTKTKEQLEIGKLGYGFIPCASHAKQVTTGTITIESLIVNRHTKLLPFPNE